MGSTSAVDSGIDERADGLPVFGALVAALLPGLVHEVLTTADGRLYRAVLDRIERPLLVLALESTGGNQLRAAKLLGINRNTLRKRLRLFGLASESRRRIATRNFAVRR